MPDERWPAIRCGQRSFRFLNRISAALLFNAFDYVQDATHNVPDMGRGPPPVEASLRLVRRGHFLRRTGLRRGLQWGFRGGF
jgi:hypothetical protein